MIFQFYYYSKLQSPYLTFLTCVNLINCLQIQLLLNDIQNLLIRVTIPIVIFNFAPEIIASVMQRRSGKQKGLKHVKKT